MLKGGSGGGGGTTNRPVECGGAKYVCTKGDTCCGFGEDVSIPTECVRVEKLA